MAVIHFAPLQGYTDSVYREAHTRVFGGVDTYYTPFVRIEKGGFRNKDLKDIACDRNRQVHVVPQLIASTPDEFRPIVRLFQENGYKEADINLGCPFPMQVRAHRGSGLLRYKEEAESLLRTIEEFPDISFFKKNVVGLAQSSIWIYSIPLKHIVTAAHYNGKIPRNPFAMYHVDPDHKEREFLTLDELTAMTDIKLEDPNMAFARDLFIFGCWTGISFIDIKNLTEDNISMVNSAPWIVSKRQKTGVPFQIKLMDIPMQIVERYKSFRKGNHLFNIGNLDGINKRIKKVAVMCGIKKRVSFHVSRHSWAVLALEYGMPIESVSKILGHTNITTTQIYAKVTSTKLDHDIAVFESRIKGHLPVMGGMA
jgi:integrase